jgi:nitrogen fixation NifU-like protein
MVMSLYKEILLDHFKNPRHYDRGQIASPSFVLAEFNPLCGDLVQVTGVISAGSLLQAAFHGKGCVISQAAASLLLEKYVGCQLNDILNLKSADILNLIGMELGPNRINCAILPLIALQKGILQSC